MLIAGFDGVALSYKSSEAPPLPIWYCFRLPYQRGLAFGSGRNMPMNTWLAFCARLVEFTGRLAEAKVELTDWISARILVSAATMAASLPALKYFPPPYLAMFRYSEVVSASGCALWTS